MVNLNDAYGINRIFSLIDSEIIYQTIGNKFIYQTIGNKFHDSKGCEWQDVCHIFNPWVGVVG